MYIYGSFSVHLELVTLLLTNCSSGVADSVNMTLKMKKNCEGLYQLLNLKLTQRELTLQENCSYNLLYTFHCIVSSYLFLYPC